MTTNQLLKDVALVSLICFLALASFLTYEVITVIEENRASISGIVEGVNNGVVRVVRKGGILQEVDKTVVDVKSLVAHADKLVDKEVKHVDEQHKAFMKVLSTADETVAEAKKTIAKFGVLTDHVDESQKAIASAAVATLTELKGRLEDSKASLDAMTKTLESTNKLIGDPNIAATINEMKKSSEHIDSMLFTLDKALAAWMKPKALWKGVLLELVPKLSQIATPLVKH